eukprot:g1793.t1
MPAEEDDGAKAAAAAATPGGKSQMQLPAVFRVTSGKAKEQKSSEAKKIFEMSSRGNADSAAAPDTAQSATLADAEEGNVRASCAERFCGRLGAGGSSSYQKLAQSEEDPLAPPPTALKVFPLIFSRFVGLSQGFFFVGAFVPALVFFVFFLQAMLQSASTVELRLRLDPARHDIVLNTDHCDVVFETDPAMPRGHVGLRVQLGFGHSHERDPKTFFSVCAPGAQPALGADGATPMAQLCRSGEAPHGEAIGFSIGCSNVTDPRSAHMCIMNVADKTFVDMAYSSWRCKVSLAASPGDTFPNVTLRSTEPELYPGLERVTMQDAEPEALVRADDGTLPYRSSRYSACSRPLNFSSLVIDAPDASVELDCFTASGPLTLRDTHAARFSIFAGGPPQRAAVSDVDVDVELATGDFYLWSYSPVSLNYPVETPESLSSLCLAADSVYKCDQQRYALAANATHSAAGRQENCGGLSSFSLAPRLRVSVANGISAWMHKHGHNTNSSVFNRVQVESGGFDDNVHKPGTSVDRDGYPRPRPLHSTINGADNLSTAISFAARDKERLQSLFHHDGAKQPENVQIVDLYITGEGLPRGHFTWYSNPIYAFLSPYVLSFISLNLLTPQSMSFELELVENFCPTSHTIDQQAVKSVLMSMYQELYDAVQPLPRFSVMGFRHVGGVYQGIAPERVPRPVVLDDFIFARDEASAQQYKVLTKAQAINGNTMFQVLIGLNIILTAVTAVLFAYFAARVSSTQRRKAVLELVEIYRRDIAGSLYMRMEEEHQKLEIDQNSHSKRVLYTVTVRTAKGRSSGTRGRVYVVLVGKTDETSEIPLIDDQGRQVFMPGCVATFAVTAADVGVIESVRVRHDPDLVSYNGPDWLLNSMSVQTPRYVPSDEPPFLDVPEVSHFPCNRWFIDVSDNVGANDQKDMESGLTQEIKCAATLKAPLGPAGGRPRRMPKQAAPAADDGGDSEDEDVVNTMHDEISLDADRRNLLNREVTDVLSPRASVFWLIDVGLCVQRQRAMVAQMGAAEDPATADETCRVFRQRLMHKYINKWRGKVDEARKEIGQRFPQIRSTLELDADGHRIVDPETGNSKGKTVIRQGVAQGYRAKKVLISDMSMEEKRNMRKEKEHAMEQNFQAFDTNGDNSLSASMLQVAMRARGIAMSIQEAADIMADLDTTDDPASMTLEEFKTLIRLKERDLPEGYEDELCFKYFADPIKNVVNFKQLKRVCKELGEEVSDQDVIEMIDRVDLSGEGTILCKEFCEVLGVPSDAGAVARKISSLPIPTPPDGSSWSSARSKSSGFSLSSRSKEGIPDRKVFERLVHRYWRAYREMDALGQENFLKMAAYASVPGQYMDELPGAAQLALLGHTEKSARRVLRQARVNMKMDSFMSWFALSPADQQRMVRLILKRPGEYFEMGITKRRWFFKQAMGDRARFLHLRAQEKRTATFAETMQGIRLQALSAMLHVVLVMGPTMPLFAAGVLYDKTYLRFNPDTDAGTHGPVMIFTMSVNFAYVGSVVLYLFFTYMVKSKRARLMRETPLEAMLKYLYLFCFFVTLFCAALVLVCALYWVVLGSVLNPERVVPYLVAVTTLFAHAGKLYGMFGKFRRVVIGHVAGFNTQADGLAKKIVAHKVKLTRTKASLMARAANVSGPAARELESKATRLSALEDKAREAKGSCSRMRSTANEFVVQQGLTQLDIVVAVVSSCLLLLLLFIFIAAGVAAFTTPSPGAAGVSSGLYLAVGKLVNGFASLGLDGEALNRVKTKLAQVRSGSLVLCGCKKVLQDAKEKFNSVMRDEGELGIELED